MLELERMKFAIIKRKRKRSQSYKKVLTPTENKKMTTQKRNQNFDFTTIADRFRKVTMYVLASNCNGFQFDKVCMYTLITY